MLIFNHLQKHNFRAISGLFPYIAHFIEQAWGFINLYTHKNKDIFYSNNIGVAPCFIFCVSLSFRPYLIKKSKDVFDEFWRITNVKDLKSAQNRDTFATLSMTNCFWVNCHIVTFFINLHIFLQIRINCIRWKPRQNSSVFTFQFQLKV